MAAPPRADPIVCTEPPSIGSSGVRIETQREGALMAEIELPLCKATTLALDRMCLLIEIPMSAPG